MRLKSIIVSGLTALLIASCSVAGAEVGPVNGHTLITQPNDGTLPLVHQINTARKSIAITIYELDNSTPIYGSLIAAAKRGVSVDITFNYSSFASSQQSSIQSFINTLQQQSPNIKTHLASNVYQVTHQKGLIIDGTSAFICSFNFTSNYFGGTRDFGIYTTNANEVAELAKVAAADFINPDKPSGTVYPGSGLTTQELVWSDAAQGNSRAKETALINSAKYSIYMYQELVEDQGILNAITQALKNNPQLDVRIIAPTMVSSTTGTDSNLAGLQTIKAAGGQYYEVNSNNANILYIHAKVILVDYGQPNNSCYIGSVNFSETSLDKNREAGIIISEQPLLESVHNTFMSDWNQQGNVPKPPVPQHTGNLPRK